MRRTLTALLALAAGCSAPPAAPGEAALETALATQLIFDPGPVKAGEWALYGVRVRGAAGTEQYRWAAVEEADGAVWIENRRPGALLVKSKLDRSGNLLEQWAGEPGGVPARVHPNPRRPPEPPPPRRDPSAAAAATEERPETLEVAGRTYACTRVTTVLTYPDGRRSAMVNWLSPEVPFPVLVGGKPRGGLVRRQIGRLTVELLEHGTGARPELAIPPK